MVMEQPTALQYDRIISIEKNYIRSLHSNDIRNKKYLCFASIKILNNI